jgi:hypothetical protein
MKKLAASSLLALTLISASTAAMAERLLVIMFGQSETSGRGVLSQVPTYPYNDRIFVFGQDGQWRQGSEPTDSNANQLYPILDDLTSIGASYGMPLANRLAELYPNDEIGVVNCSKGNSKVAQFRRFWTTDTRYGACLALTLEAMTTARPIGLVFWVGATDAEVQADALGWKEDATHLLGAFRSDIANLSLPVVVARLNNGTHTGKPYWNTIRADQMEMVAHKFSVVSTDGISYDSINVHPTTAGNQEVGVRFADAIFALQ